MAATVVAYGRVEKLRPQAVTRVTAMAGRIELIQGFVLRELRARYAQSLLGIAWAIVNPMALSLIQALMLRFVLRVDTTIPVIVFTYIGNLHWTLFSGGISGATDSLVGQMGLISRLRFPRETIPLASVFGRVPDFLFGLIGLFVILLLFPTEVGPGIILVPFLLVIQIVLAAGLGLIASSVNVFYRDARHVVGLVLALWYYLVPVIYPLELVPEQFRPLYLANPMAAVIDTSRRVAFPAVSGPVQWEYVLLAAVVATVTLFVGLMIFRRAEPAFAEAI